MNYPLPTPDALPPIPSSLFASDPQTALARQQEQDQADINFRDYVARQQAERAAQKTAQDAMARQRETEMQGNDIHAAALRAQVAATQGGPVDKPAIERAALAARAATRPPVDMATAPAPEALRSMAATGQTPLADNPGGGGGHQDTPPEQKPTSNESYIHYSTDGGPMQTWAPGQSGGGTVSSPGGTGDDAYERYRRNLYGDQQVDYEKRQHALDSALTADPFARERTLADIDLKKEAGLKSFAADLQAKQENERRETYAMRVRQIDEAWARAKSRPKEDLDRLKAMGRDPDTWREQQMASLKESFGFGERLGGSGLLR